MARPDGDGRHSITGATPTARIRLRAAAAVPKAETVAEPKIIAETVMTVMTVMTVAVPKITAETVADSDSVNGSNSDNDRIELIMTC